MSAYRDQAVKAVSDPQTEYEQDLKSKHGKVGAVSLTSGGYAYFRRPTIEEHATFQSLAQEDGSARVTAYARYVRGCYVGAYPDLVATIDSIVAEEGPGIVAGAFGQCVNRLAGGNDRPTRML